MDSFTGHMFRASYQHMMEKNIMSNIPIDQCAVVMDFSEHISMQAQDQIESAHWTTKQVTLHPIHIVRHAESSTTENPVLMKESLIILSDCLAHNSAAVYVFTQQLLLHLKNNPGPCDIKVIHRFTDNCATQYKCKDAFSHIKLLEDVHGVKMVYHYTEAGHGKGPSDGLGAAIKKRLERLVLGGKVINNAYQAYLALVQTQREEGNQTIIYLPQTKMTKEMPPKVPGIKTIKGTQSFRMVRQHCDAGVLDCWDLSCTCMVCITTDQEGPCYFSQYRHEPQRHNILNTRSCGGNVTNGSGDGLVSCSSDRQCDDPVLDQTMLLSVKTHCEHVSSNANQMCMFSYSIATKGWQIRDETPQDGNCAFWAISDQLERTGGHPYTHTQLRENVVKFIEDLPESDQVNLSQFLDQSVDSYLQGMKCDSTYADHVCLQSVSKLLSVELLIVHAELQDIKLSPTAGASTSTLVLGYIPELQHYVSLEPLKRFELEDFVAVVLSSEKRRRVYIAKVLQTDQEDVKLRFLQASRPVGIYTWPETDDIAWQPHLDVLKKLTPPELLPGRGLKMKFNISEIQSLR